MPKGLPKRTYITTETTANGSKIKCEYSSGWGKFKVERIESGTQKRCPIGLALNT